MKQAGAVLDSTRKAGIGVKKGSARAASKVVAALVLAVAGGLAGAGSIQAQERDGVPLDFYPLAPCRVYDSRDLRDTHVNRLPMKNIGCQTGCPIPAAQNNNRKACKCEFWEGSYHTEARSYANLPKPGNDLPPAPSEPQTHAQLTYDYTYTLPVAGRCGLPSRTTAPVDAGGGGLRTIEVNVTVVSPRWRGQLWFAERPQDIAADARGTNRLLGMYFVWPMIDHYSLEVVRLPLDHPDYEDKRYEGPTRATRMLLPVDTNGTISFRAEAIISYSTVPDPPYGCTYAQPCVDWYAKDGYDLVVDITGFYALPPEAFD